MNWEAIGAIAELLGAIGVIASLFYLAVQIRRNSESIEASAVLAVSESSQQRLLAAAQSPALADAMRKAYAGEELSLTERSQVMFFARAVFRGLENAFAQHRRGFVSDEVWCGYEALLSTHLQIPLVAEWWPTENWTYTADFRQHVNELAGRSAA